MGVFTGSGLPVPTTTEICQKCLESFLRFGLLVGSAKFAAGAFSEVRLGADGWRLLASTDRLGARDQGAQPHTPRRVARYQVAEIVDAQVHPAETDQEHKENRPEHRGSPPPPTL